MIGRTTLDFVTNLEGKEERAYKDSVGLWTIGVGHLIKDNEHALITKELSKDDIDQLLFYDLKIAEKAVKDNIKIPYNQSQFDSLCSFAFNVGVTAFKNSTLLKKINSRATRVEIEKEFMKWTKAGGKESEGLKNRRIKEVQKYFSK